MEHDPGLNVVKKTIITQQKNLLEAYQMHTNAQESSISLKSEQERQQKEFAQKKGMEYRQRLQCYWLMLNTVYDSIAEQLKHITQFQQNIYQGLQNIRSMLNQTGKAKTNKSQISTNIEQQSKTKLPKLSNSKEDLALLTFGNIVHSVNENLKKKVIAGKTDFHQRIYSVV